MKPSQARDVAVSLSICRRNPPQDAYTQAVDWVASHFFCDFHRFVYIKSIQKSQRTLEQFFLAKDTSSGMGLVRSAGFFRQLQFSSAST